MTSLGRKGNTKIAGQPGSQPWAWTPDRTKVHNVFSMCLISPLTTIFPPSLCLPPSFSPFSHSFIIPLYRQPSLSLSLSTFLCLSPRLCGRGGKVTRSTLGRLQCAELLQVQGIICCFGKEVEMEEFRGVVGRGWTKEGRDGLLESMDRWTDGWVNRWPGGQDKFTQSHILVRFHKGELSWQNTSSPAQQIRGEKRTEKRRMDGGKWEQAFLLIIAFLQC